MIFDTDVLIWAQRGHPRAAAVIAAATLRQMSAQTYLELLQGARNKKDLRLIRKFVAEADFAILPLTENIGHRAIVYMEEYALASGLQAGDALIAATAVEHSAPLVSSDRKPYRTIRELDLHMFRPGA